MRHLTAAGALSAPLLCLLLACGEGSAGPPGAPPAPSPEKEKEGMEMGPRADSARAKYPDFPALFDRSLQRTCSPNFGVCHRSRQYPDMSTAASFVAAIGQRCNQLRDEPTTVDNICEPAGDELQLAAGGVTYRGHIGAVSVLPPDATLLTATHVVLRLREPLPTAYVATAAAALVRTTPGLGELLMNLPANIVADAQQGEATVILTAAPLRSATVAGVRWTDFLLPPKYIPGSMAQVHLGDPNGDGVFGAALGGQEIKPGDPRGSYLYLRSIAPLAAPSMISNTKPPAPMIESQMPLANYDYWDIEPAIEALYCWIKGLRPDGGNALGKIDYDACGELPEDLRPRHQGGEASTWSGIWANILQPSCATSGCHDKGTRAGELDLGDVQGAWTALWNRPPAQRVADPEVKLVYPFNPDASYLMQKLKGTAAAGARMPLGRELPQRDKAIEAIVTWINQGARNN